MKAFTDIEQSKKLAEILPLKSADMYIDTTVAPSFTGLIREDVPRPVTINDLTGNKGVYPCWSLAALLSVLPDDTDMVKDKADSENEKYMCTVGVKDDIISTFGNNPVDACVDMLLKLKEKNLL